MVRKVIFIIIIALIFTSFTHWPVNLYAGDGCEGYHSNLEEAQSKIINSFLDNKIDEIRPHLEDFLYYCHLSNIRCSQGSLTSTPLNDLIALGPNFDFTIYKVGFFLFSKEYRLNPAIFVSGKSFQK